ncbi:MAG: Bax inhibitor-1 family protein [Planctomycetota bacterium]
MRRFAEQMGWASDRGGFAIEAAVDERLGFLRKTYGLLTLQILAVGGLSALLIQNEPLLISLYNLVWGHGILLTLALLIGFSFVTRRMLATHKPLGVQYAAAALWVALFTTIVAPSTYAAKELTGSYAIVLQAFILTVCVFGGLTAYVLTTKKDFSPIGGFLSVALVSMVAIAIMGSFMGFGGIWMSFVFVAIFAGYVLYDTSQILHRRGTDEYVSASVDLLTDFVFLFLHILSILMSNRD